MSKYLVEERDDEVTCSFDECDVELPESEMKQYKKKWYCKDHYKEIKTSGSSGGDGIKADIKELKDLITTAIIQTHEPKNLSTIDIDIPEEIMNGKIIDKVKFVVVYLGSKFKTFSYEDIIRACDEAFPNVMAPSTPSRILRKLVARKMIYRIMENKKPSGFFRLKSAYKIKDMDERDKT